MKLDKLLLEAKRLGSPRYEERSGNLLSPTEEAKVINDFARRLRWAVDAMNYAIDSPDRREANGRLAITVNKILNPPTSVAEEVAGRCPKCGEPSKQ